jgi:putative ABC transport system permease protein
VKYLPLVWSALWRKPAETILIWLAVTAAFTLLGLMAGLQTTYRDLVARSRMDRLDVNARFPSADPHGEFLPIGLRRQIAELDGVSAVGSYYMLWGYYQNPRNHARVIAVDKYMDAAWSELPLTPAQWHQLFATQTGIFVSRSPARRLGLKKGGAFPFVTSPGLRADGVSTWEFNVLGIVKDDPRIGAFIIGNYSYVDNSRPLREQGLVSGFRVAVRDAAMADDVSVRIDRHFANSSTPTLTIPDKANMIYVVNSGYSIAKAIWPLAGAGLFMILLLIANGIAQSVRERITEFAVLETIGYPVTLLMGLVFAEALIPCLAGALIGSGLADMITDLPGHYLPRDLANIPTPTLTAAVVGWCIAAGLAIATAGTILPLARLRRMRVTDALAGH